MIRLSSTPLRKRWLGLLAAGLAACHSPGGGASEWRAGVGTAEIVLPGFDPVSLRGETVVLGGRREYIWRGEDLLPSELRARGGRAARSLKLVGLQGGQDRHWQSESLRAELAPNGHHATLTATGRPLPDLDVTVTTRVEYDGVAFVRVELRPRKPVSVEGLRFEMRVPRNAHTRLLRFSADTIRGQKRRHVIDPAYRGPFVNALGLADGERSMWWFADNAEGWVYNDQDVTVVEPHGDEFLVRQQIFAQPVTLDAPRVIEFNFHATPSRDLGSAWRKDRIVSVAKRKWAGMGRFQLWWTTVFAHWLLPYTTLPEGVPERLPAADRKLYPGAAATRKMMRDYPRKFGFHRIPYFSAHVISSIDPVLERHRAEWEVEPPYVNTSKHPRMKSFPKPTLSHRATGYQDYLLDRFSHEIDALDMPGLYLDQGKVMDSRNPHHGAWRDAQGRVQSSLDILGTRRFLKRLRTLFHQKGQPGWIFVHNSNGELAPAYGFITAGVMGEEFRHHLVDDDYIGSISLDAVRTQFAPGQYGVRSIWIPQFFFFHRGDESWEGSREQERATRNFLALALLHDVDVQPVGIHFETWKTLIGQLDRFGVDRADFLGYWRGDSGISSGTRSAVVSHYRLGRRRLLVVANLGKKARTVRLDLDPAVHGARARFRNAAGGWRPIRENTLALEVAGRDYRLVELETGT